MYKIKDYLMHKDTNELFVVEDIVVEFEYLQVTTYNIRNVRTGEPMDASSTYLSRYFYSVKTLDEKLMLVEKQINKMVDEKSDIMWAKAEMLNKIKLYERKES